MNNGQLKQRLIDRSHRADLSDHVQGFINTATVRLNVRFGHSYGDMVQDGDSNPTLAEFSPLYEYSGMRELSIHIKDFEEAVRYDELFEKEVRRMNIHVVSDNWVTNATELTYVRSEAETAAILESA